MPRRSYARTVSHEQIARMGRTGFRAALIAQRLGCSVRHARRVLREQGVTPVPNPVLGTDDEPLLWAGYRAWGESYRQIGERFGVSHEYVRRTLTR